MTFVELTAVPPAESSHRLQLQRNFADCRRLTLELVQGCDRDTLCTQSHPDFSPVGWHLGHIAFTESLWILEQLAGQRCRFPQYKKLFAADGLPKAERQNLPNLSELLAFLADVRAEVEQYLAIAPLSESERRLWHWLLQHESQHCETIAIVLAMHNRYTLPNASPPVAAAGDEVLIDGELTDEVLIPAGPCELGYNGIEAIDNETPAYTVELADFWIDRGLVTQADYRRFIDAGYDSPRWWTPEGWRWCQQSQVRQPLYWREDPQWDGVPVCGVSWYEADAYARFVHKRLPTEAEWEKAARVLLMQNSLSMQNSPGDSLGDRWQWTSTWFAPYPRFAAYPYPGYSQVYFDGAHRVLRGGSRATRPWALRPTFRNWYHPHMQQMFSGIRCARSA